MISRWKTPLITFSIFSLFLYIGVQFLNRKIEEPFDRFRIPGKDRYFVFIISANNAQEHCEQTLGSILEQNYQNFKIIYIDDGSTDKTYEIATNFIKNYYPFAPVVLIRNEIQIGAMQNAYKHIQECQNYDVVALLDDNCYLNHTNALREFNNLYKVDKIWLAYGQHESLDTKVQGSCRPVPNLALFPAMRKRYWKRPLLKTFYAGLFRKVKLEDFFFDSKFIDNKYDAAYMFPMIEMAGKNVGFVPNPVCCYKNSEKVTVPLKNANHKDWICKADPYQPLEKHPGAIRKEIPTTLTADLLAFSFDRPLQLYAHLESLDHYMKNLNSISVIYRASDDRFFQAYKKVQIAFPHVRFIKQSQHPEVDFKPLALQAIFENSIEASPFIIFSSDNIILQDHIDIDHCIKCMKKTGAYYFALKLDKDEHPPYSENKTSNEPYYIQIGKNTFGWQINEARGDWKKANHIEMNMYRKVDLHKAYYSIHFRNPTELEKNWVDKTKPFLREQRQRVGICYNDPKIINIGEDIRTHFSNRTLLSLFERGLKIDINSLSKSDDSKLSNNAKPKFIQQKDLAALEK